MAKRNHSKHNRMAKRSRPKLTKMVKKPALQMDKRIILAVIVIVAAVAFLLLSGPKPAAPSCGDGACTETCSSCPSDCGVCPAPTNVTLITINRSEDLNKYLPQKDCQGMNDSAAYSRSLQTGENYCGCVSIDSYKASCMEAILDKYYFETAIKTFDPSLCAGISNPYAKESCASIVSSGADYVEDKDTTQLIYIYLESGSYEAMIPLAESVLAEDPNSLMANLALAQAYTDMSWADFGAGENAAKAEGYLKKALEISPQSSEVYRLKGNLAEVKQDIGDALVNYDKAIELDPTSALAYTSRGHANRMVGALDLALSDLLKAKELDPEHEILTVYRNLCTLMASNDEYMEEAVANCMIVIESDRVSTPIKSEALGTLGSMYMDAERYEEAFGLFETALTNNPDDANIYVYMATAHNQLGEYGEAQEAAEKAIGIDPQKSTAYSALAYSLYRQSEFDSAISAAEKGLSLLSQDASLLSSSIPAYQRELYYILANIYNRTGDTANENKYKGLGDAI